MEIKVNRSLVPIKAHFFFFFAALGPLLPQLNVFGRQLGITPYVMGMVTAILPLLWAAAKPLFGYVVDFWPNHRKLVFMMLITTMTGSYCGLWFLPVPDTSYTAIEEHVYRLNDTVYLKSRNVTHDVALEKFSCHWTCFRSSNFDVYLTNTTYVNTVYIDGGVANNSCSLLHMDFNDVREGQIVCSAQDGCQLLCFDDSNISNEIDYTLLNVADKNNLSVVNNSGVVMKNFTNEPRRDYYDMSSVVFWSFVVLMCLGTVAFNVANCIGDAVCFDVLGPERGPKYGSQRAWGTVGYGLTALLSGWLVDLVSTGAAKDFTPAFIIAIVATAVDLYSCRNLKLPSLSSPSDSGKALLEVMKIPRVVVFILFAVIAGTFDSFIIYYMFWFLEGLAEETGHMGQIKLIEGVVVAGQSFVGELLFFYYSGKIIKRWGFGATMTFSLFCYGLRLGLISLIQHPWYLVFIELVMQGPTYALCYSTIVGYAAHVAPPGYSATVQGIVAGMDDGLGFALGSLLGGVLYSTLGGRQTFRILGIVAIAASILHALLYALVGSENEKKTEEVTPEGEKMLSSDQKRRSAIYQDTVVPLTANKTDNR